MDHSSDLWTLGVLLHEMYMLRTPFVDEEDPDNMETLFQSIMHVRVRVHMAAAVYSFILPLL